VQSNAVLSRQRKQQILDLVKSRGQVVVRELSGEWDVSEDTVRRDLRDLARDGLLQRVHGGALAASAAVTDYAGRQEIAPESKDRIGRAGAGLVHPGQVVAVDGGTSTSAMIRHLPRDLRATILTHSPTIAAELRLHQGIEVILIGGKLFRHSMVCVGSETVEAIHRTRADLFFLGATGIHPETGVTTGDWEEAAVKRAFSACSGETILMASPEKLDAASPYQVIALDGIDVLIVDSATDSPVVKRCEEMGVTVIRA
jgi:DeoR/GlpR family transcriptional regulator of sugar metabolism